MLSLQFKRIEQLIICGICYEYMKTCVMTPCSHNYCSLCIRKYLHYKTQCPACFEETFETDLRVNKVLDEIVLCISEIKNNASKFSRKENAEILGQIKPELSVLHSLPSAEIQSIENDKHAFQNEGKHNSIENTVVDAKVTSPSVKKVLDKSISSPSTSGQSKMHSIFTPKSRKTQQNMQANNIDNQKTVTCPVCKVDISEVNINRHLDDCLKREDGKACFHKSELKRKPLPKLVFSLMKDAELRRKVKELKLSSQGDRKVLEARLQRYITVYNAECDKPNPRPVTELIKQCEEEEALEKKVQRSSSTINRLQVTRSTEQNLIEEAQKKYLEVNKDSFASLIMKARGTVGDKRPTVRRAIFEQSPRKMQAISEDDVIASNKAEDCCLDYNDAGYPDSDSDSVCPLQIYSSEDPRSFLAIEISGALSNEANQKNAGSPVRKRHASLLDTANTPSRCLSSPQRGRVPSKKDISASLDRCAPVQQTFIDKKGSSQTPSYISDSPSSTEISSPLQNPATASRDGRTTCNTPSRYKLYQSSTDSTSLSYENPQSVQNAYTSSQSNNVIESSVIEGTLSPILLKQSGVNKKNERKGRHIFQEKHNRSLISNADDTNHAGSYEPDLKLGNLRTQRPMYCTQSTDSLDNSSSNDSFKSNHERMMGESQDSKYEVPIGRLQRHTRLEKENVQAMLEHSSVERVIKKRIREVSVNSEEKSPKRERRATRMLNPSADPLTKQSNAEVSVFSVDRKKRTRKKITLEESESDANRRTTGRTRSKKPVS